MQLYIYRSFAKKYESTPSLSACRKPGNVFPGSIDPPRRQLFGIEEREELMTIMTAADCFLVMQSFWVGKG